MKLDQDQLNTISQGFHTEATQSWSLHADCYLDPDILDSCGVVSMAEYDAHALSRPR